jgi:TM2 domain-containing membrane protein YozV
MLTATSQLNFGRASSYSGNDKSLALALILDFFLGDLGIHRIYLGTATWTWVGYILSCGGIFGIVPFVDFIVLIVHNQDISQYEDNTRFFMWG